MSLQLQLPLPDQRAAETLRQQIVNHLVAKQPEVGSALFSESELMRRAKVSRSTVRRALEPLERSGWIERQQGKGTFVGPRVAMVQGRDLIDAVGSTSSVTQRLVRLAVVANRMSPWNDDPYSREVVAGLDAAADESSISVELLGFPKHQPEVTVRRLRQSRPDVIAILAPQGQHARLIGAAMLMKIPCIGTGHSAELFGIPTVSYKDDQGAAMAVAELARLGHRRIAFLQTETMLPFVYRRQRGYRQGILDAGIEPDNNLELTFPSWDASKVESPQSHVELLDAFIKRMKPTAIIAGLGHIMGVVATLYRDGRLRVPQDVSLLTFDGIYAAYAVWFNGMKPTTIKLPLDEVGRSLATLAHEVLEEPAGTHRTIVHPCRLAAGDSTAPPHS